MIVRINCMFVLFSLLLYSSFAVAQPAQPGADTTVMDSTSLEAPVESTVESTVTGPVLSQFRFFNADYSLFHYSNSAVQMEVYALIDRQFLALDTLENGVQAHYQITFKVLQNDSLVTGDSWTRTDFSESLDSRHSGQRIPEMAQYIAVPGDYQVEVVVVDLVANVYQSDELTVHVELFSPTELVISDITYASMIQRSDDFASEFNHNGLLVLPNAERIFGTGNNTLYYYSEVYNLTVGDSTEYIVQREVLNDRRQVELSLPPRHRHIPAPDIVEYGSFDVDELNTGSYIFQITVTDVASGIVVSQERPFWVYFVGQEVRPVYRIPDIGADFNMISDEEILQEMEWVYYIMPSNVARAAREIDSPEARRAFLAQFWRANDPDQDTPICELRTEYLSRVTEANARFSSFTRDGWETDRGRVYVLFGEPDHIDDHSFDMDANKAYQIWEFDAIEGGVHFVFVDRTNNGNYVQVHSNKEGEIYNPNWRQTEVQGY